MFDNYGKYTKRDPYVKGLLLRDGVMKHIHGVFLFCMIAAIAAAGPSPASAQSAKEINNNRNADRNASGRIEVPLPAEKWTGDLDGMMERRIIRVLVVMGKTSFFIDKGTRRGITCEAMEALEKTINKKLKAGRHIDIVYIPVARDKLIPSLISGVGDIAEANLTITPEREALVDFSDPGVTGVKEIVVTGPSSPRISTLDDLSGKQVFVRPSSSYHASLTRLNEDFRGRGMAEVVLKPAPEDLEDEDLLEMLNAGLLQILIVDSHKAELWAKVFPGIKLHPDAAVRTGGRIALAIRKNSPKLKAGLNEFIRNVGGALSQDELLSWYLKRLPYVKNATSEQEIKKFEQLIDIFNRYGDRYGVDHLLMLAQGYQESRLDQSVKSPRGAVGVMQVLPETGRLMNVGDIRVLEPNIHAGIKYMRFMVDKYYADESMDSLNKALFAFASYNAGPSRIQKFRETASSRGLNPNVWMNNVELVAAEKVGREVTQYVGNIYKYYVAYRLVKEQQLEREQERKRWMEERHK